jgi:chemotaxis protein MotA
MEIATFIGAIVAIILLSSSIVIAGGNLLGFVDPPAALIIGGGIVCGVLISFPLTEFMRLPGVIKNTFFHSGQDMMAIINQLVQIAEMARREGVLSLDSKIGELDGDPFLANGLRMVVDGMQPTAVESILESEIEFLGARHSVGAEMVSTLGKAAPVFGLVATLMGLVLMLSNMDPETIGEKMSVALLGTFYGCVSANLFLLPFAAKLRYFNKQELALMELKMQGILEIQKGEAPRIVKLKLLTRIPENKRPKEADV